MRHPETGGSSPDLPLTSGVTLCNSLCPSHLQFSYLERKKSFIYSTNIYWTPIASSTFMFWGHFGEQKEHGPCSILVEILDSRTYSLNNAFFPEPRLSVSVSSHSLSGGENLKWQQFRWREFGVSLAILCFCCFSLSLWLATQECLRMGIEPETEKQGKSFLLCISIDPFPLSFFLHPDPLMQGS